MRVEYWKVHDDFRFQMIAALAALDWNFIKTNALISKPPFSIVSRFAGF